MGRCEHMVMDGGGEAGMKLHLGASTDQVLIRRPVP